MATRTDVTVTKEGFVELEVKLQDMGKALGNAVLAEIVRQASVPVVAAMKSTVPFEIGITQRAVSAKVIKFTKVGPSINGAMAIIGVDTKKLKIERLTKKLRKLFDSTRAGRNLQSKGAEGARPSNIAHLLEFGHSGRPGTGWMRKAALASEAEASRIVETGVGAAIDKVVRRRIKRAARKSA